MTGQNGQRTNRRVVYETLRRKVLTLELPPGAPLSENELAAALGVSRTPVREGLILLAEEGLVQVFPQVGSFVSRVDIRRVADAQFVREAVELAALDDIPSEPSAEVVAELEDNLAKQQASDLGLEEFFALDEEFHHGLLRLSGHDSAWRTVVAAKGHLDRARRLGIADAESRQAFVVQHVEIFTAIRSRELEGARAQLRKHLRAVFEDVEQIRQASPELFATNDTRPTRRSVASWD
jgi:DNA-binding GntR family transcriptional regulator